MAKGKKTSAGVLLFRRTGNAVEFLIVHPGGPYWAEKDLGAWSVAKGELDPGEDPETAALASRWAITVRPVSTNWTGRSGFGVTNARFVRP